MWPSMNYQRIVPYAAWSLPAGWSIIVFLLLTQKVHRYVPGWLPYWADKPAHILLFGSLAVFTYIAFRFGSSVAMPLAAAISFAYAAAYGAVLEGYQHYIPWRTSDWLDVLANTAGAAIVFFLLIVDRFFVVRQPA